MRKVDPVDGGCERASAQSVGVLHLGHIKLIYMHATRALCVGMSTCGCCIFAFLPLILSESPEPGWPIPWPSTRAPTGHPLKRVTKGHRPSERWRRRRHETGGASAGIPVRRTRMPGDTGAKVRYRGACMHACVQDLMFVLGEHALQRKSNGKMAPP